MYRLEPLKDSHLYFSRVEFRQEKVRESPGTDAEKSKGVCRGITGAWSKGNISEGNIFKTMVTKGHRSIRQS